MADTVSAPSTKSLKRAHVKGRYSKDLFILQQLVGKDFKLRYRRSVLGVIWSVLNPLLMMIIMSFVFSYFLKSGDIQNYPLYLIVGNITFMLMSDATNGGLNSIIGAASLLKKVKIDRWVFPVQKVFSAAVNFVFSLIVSPSSCCSSESRPPSTCSGCSWRCFCSWSSASASACSSARSRSSSAT